MRMHSSSPASQVSVPLPVPAILPSSLQNGIDSSGNNSSPLVDRYCQDCDIRFYSVKTLKAHKMHYCSSRYGKNSSPTSKNSSASTSPTASQIFSPEPSCPKKMGQSGEQPFLLLRTNPVLIVPYSLLQSASIFTGTSPNFSSQDSPCILMPNGTLQPMSNLVSQLTNGKDLGKNYSSSAKQKVRDESPPAKSSRTKLDSTPLDLSVRKVSDNKESHVINMEDEKENVFSTNPDHDEYPSTVNVMHGNAVSSEKYGEDRKELDLRRPRTSSPNHSPSSNPKKSPRRTPNGLNGGVPIESGKSKDGRRESNSDYQYCFSEPSKKNSMDVKSSGLSYSLNPSQFPLLLSGTTSEFFNQASALPLLTTDLGVRNLAGGQSITESPSQVTVLSK